MTILPLHRVAVRLAVASAMVAATAFAAAAQASHNCLPATAPDSTAPTIRKEAVNILSDTAAGARSMRLAFGIAAGTTADVSIVQDDGVCNAAMSAFEAVTGKQFPEAFVIVRMGHAAPYFYLMTPRRDGALTARYLLNDQFTLLTFVGTEG